LSIPPIRQFDHPFIPLSFHWKNGLNRLNPVKKIIQRFLKTSICMGRAGFSAREIAVIPLQKTLVRADEGVFLQAPGNPE